PDLDREEEGPRHEPGEPEIGRIDLDQDPSGRGHGRGRESDPGAPAPAPPVAAVPGRRLLATEPLRGSPDAGGVVEGDDLPPGRDRVGLPARRWHRHHEHHAGLGHGAYARDRPADGGRRPAASHPAPVPDRGRHALADRRDRRRRARPQRLARDQLLRRVAHPRRAGRHRTRLRPRRPTRVAAPRPTPAEKRLLGLSREIARLPLAAALGKLASAWAPGGPLLYEVATAWTESRGNKTSALALAWAREQVRLSLQEI